MHINRRILFVTGAIAILAACESRLTGNEGNFVFSYPADDDIFDFNKPIAVGAYLDITVEGAGDNAPIELSDAKSEDPALEVTAIEGGVFTVKAAEEGNALVRVSGARNGGDMLEDSVNLLARVPEVHNLRHTCGEDGATAYLTGQPAWVPFDFEMSNGQSVIGYGYYPVSFDGAASLDASHQGWQFMKLDVGPVGSTTMTSGIDGQTLDLTVVDEAAIDGVEDPIAFVLEDIDVGDRNAFYVRPMVGSRTICQSQAAMTVTADTTEICAVRGIGPMAGEDSAEGREGGWFEVEGLSEGTCTFTVSYPASGASAQFTYPIEP